MPGRYNAQFEMCALVFLIVIALHFFMRPRYPNRLNRFFSFFILIGFVDIAADVFSAYVIANAAGLPLWIDWTVNMVLFYCQITLAPLLFLYVSCMAGTLRQENRRWHILAMLPFAVTFVLLSLNPALHTVFYFDENFSYRHGPLFLSLYAGTVFYLALSCAVILQHKKRLRLVEYTTLLAFILANVTAILLQYLFPAYLITGVALSISIMMMYLTLQNPDEMLDPLTDVFNRTAFLLYIDSLLKEERRFQIAVFDLDDMSAVNSVFGIAVGDDALHEVAAYLQRITRGSRLFRIIGDSFAVVTTTERACTRIVSTASERFRERWDIGAFTMNLSVCIGYSCEVWRCSNTDEVVTLAGEVLGDAKKSGRGSIASSGESAVLRVRRQAHVEELLRRAIDGDTVEVWLQPIVRLDAGRPAAAEALARIRDENGSIVMPGEFIPIAERTGLIVPLGTQVFDKACRFLRDSGLNDDAEFEKVCINLSVVECIDELLTCKIYDIVGKYGIRPSKLCFEITETTATLSETLPARMKALCAEGYGFALDDFGTGYANYDSIMRLPFRVVKMDKSLFDISLVDKKSETVFFHTIEMVRALGLNVVVEGVETAQQAALLTQHGVSYAQGYYFARPLSGPDFLALYKSEGQPG